MRARHALLGLLIFLAALTPRLAIVAQPIPWQLDRALPDDAYYYFLTAQNIARTGSPSVDGLHPSNGWHPLWMAVNIAVFAPDYADPDVPVRLVIALGALCDSLAALALFLLIRPRAGDAPAVIAGLFYALNTMPMLQAVNGLETGLAALCVVCAAWLTLRLTEAERITPLLVAAWGAAFGLAFLARTDTALILVPLGLYAAWMLRRRLGSVIAGGAVAVLVIAPWLVINTVVFGSPLEQVSASAVPWAARARFDAATPGASHLAHGISVLLGAPYWLRGDYLGAPPLIGFVLWIPGLIGLVAGLRSRERRSLTAVGTLLLIGGAALLIAHTVVRWYPRPWYFVVMAASLAIALALFWSGVRVPAVRLIVAGVGALGMAIGGVYAVQIGYYPWQSGHQYVAALWARDNTPPDALLASMNSGIIGYYSGRVTVNMDGVVNPEAFAAIRERRMLDFMRGLGVLYLIDSDNAVEREYALFMGGALSEGEVISAPYPGLGVMQVYPVGG
jgi:4-amino-4-deoxy-L-arabinose transferase-like glycosyltransferase